MDILKMAMAAKANAKIPSGVPYAATKYTTIAEGLECKSPDATYVNGAVPYEGKKYRITWDGVAYICAAEKYGTSASVTRYRVCAPDCTFSEDGNTVTGGSFVMLVYWFNSLPPVSETTWTMNAWGENAHTFSVEEIEEAVRQIDPRCLPEGVPYINRVEFRPRLNSGKAQVEVDGYTLVKVSDKLPTTGEIFFEAYKDGSKDYDYTPDHGDISYTGDVAYAGGIPFWAVCFSANDELGAEAGTYALAMEGYDTVLWWQEEQMLDPKLLPTENWTFELEDGSHVIKDVAVAMSREVDA